MLMREQEVKLTARRNAVIATLQSPDTDKDALDALLREINQEADDLHEYRLSQRR